jgi:uncharacterized protein
MITDFYTGAPVPPEDLMFRDEFIAELWKKLEKEHVLLTAPRRTGKTSVMNHMLDRPKDGYIVVSQNVQDFADPSQLFETIIENFYEEHPHFLRDLVGKGWKQLGKIYEVVKGQFKEVEAGGVKLALRESAPDWRVNWKHYADELLERIRKTDKKVLIILDELPDMLLNMKAVDPQKAREFMAWFRRIRETPPPHKDTIRWLVGGSINLVGTLDDLGGIDLINNLSQERLPVFTPEEVEEFVMKMLEERSVKFQPEVPSLVEKHLGRPIPIFLQMATQELYRRWKCQQKELTATDVEAVFDELITGSGAHDKLQHYYSRIQRYYEKPRDDLARRILSLVSKSGHNGLTRKAIKADFEAAIGTTMDQHERDQL